MKPYDAVILGAGGAGLMCAIAAGQRGKKVAVIDHSAKAGGKIIISGGGRCNFTNRNVTTDNFVSENEHFARSALSRFTPDDFIALVEKRGIAYHERKHGQLFCDASAQQIIDMLVGECAELGVEIFLQREIRAVHKLDEVFAVSTDRGEFSGRRLVVATGGLSFPKFGASAVGYDIARRFGLSVTACSPALDGFVFGSVERKSFEGFSGIALDAIVTANGMGFRENLLFTHAGLSGPAALQASLYWKAGDEVLINFIPTLTREELADWFSSRKGNRAEIKNQMTAFVPRRLAEYLCDAYLPEALDMGNFPKKDIAAFCERLQNWRFIPERTVGYGKAEVTRGGVDTSELSSKTMESKKVPGLYFVGEVIDVTGWLGGFNYQWAWASGRAAGEAI